MTHEWGLLIVLYLFLGGLSAGLLVLSSLAMSGGGERFRSVAVIGAWLAPWPVLVGTGLLVLDLGQPFYFWKLLVAVEPQSPMWLGTWLLTLFLIVSVPYSYLCAPAYWQGWTPTDDGRWRRRLAVAGVVVGIGVGIYTGVLLGVLVARPLWNTPLLAQLFVVSALSSGAALLLILCRDFGTAGERHVLAIGDAGLIVAELLVLAWMFVDASTSTSSARAAVSLLNHGALGWTFWVGVVLLGLVLPLAIEAMELAAPRRGRAFARAVAAVPVLVLTGGFLLRLVFVYAGQSSRLL